MVASRSHLTPETEMLVEQMKQQGKEVQLVSKGSSLKICLVAEGSADIYPRFGPTFEWDTAAGHAIALASGAKVVAVEEGSVDLAAMDGLPNKPKRPFYPMKYNKSSLLNPLVHHKTIILQGDGKTALGHRMIIHARSITHGELR